jgi:hypothetical protein
VTVSAAATAAFVKTDTTTAGNSIGAFGSQGDDVIDNAAGLPTHATVTLSGAPHSPRSTNTTLKLASGRSLYRLQLHRRLLVREHPLHSKREPY